MEQTSNHVVSTNASILNTTTLLASPSHPNKVEAKKVPLVGKIPVIISEAEVQVYVDATVQLEEPALEITRIKKNVFLTRCQLLSTDDKKSSKLLISGFVRKNIEYSTAKHVGNTSVSGDIHFTVVNIPFKCFTKVDFVTEPVTAFNPQVLTSSAISYNGMGSDPSSLNITNSEIFNERIFCELIESKIREIDIKKDMEVVTHSSGRCTNERTFKTFIESMIIELKIRVMQNQTVHISPIGAGSKDSDGGKGGDNDSGKGGNGDNGKGGDKNDGKSDKDSGKDGNGNSGKNGKGNSAEDKNNGQKSDKQGEGKKGESGNNRKDQKDEGDNNKKDRKDEDKKDEADNKKEDRKDEDKSSKDDKEAAAPSEQKKEDTDSGNQDDKSTKNE